MNMLKLFTSLRRKLIEPTVYAVSLKTASATHLWLGCAYSLEEAVDSAATDLNLPRGTFDLFLYSHQTPQKLFEPVSDPVVAVTKEKVLEKNELMKKILDKSNLGFLEKNRESLTTEEYNYLREKITKTA